MADDKHKTKKALLGELESIKSLLDEPIDDVIDFDGIADSDDDLIEPPILTTAIDEPADLDDDIPILTEAFDSSVAESELSRSISDSQIEAEDIPVLREPVDHGAKTGQTPIIPPEAKKQVFEEPVFEQWPEDELEADSNDHPQEEPDTSSEEIEGSLFDNLETEFKQQWDADEDESAEDKVASDDFDIENLETPPEPIKEKPLKDLPIINKSKKDDSAKNLESTTTESQPSLFDSNIEKSISTHSENLRKSNSGDADTSKANDTIDSIPTLSTGKEKQQTTSSTGQLASAASQRPIKTDNPFLPKHIRDRLHTSRSLQDEIMESPLFKTAAAKVESQNNSALEKKSVDLDKPIMEKPHALESENPKRGTSSAHQTPEQDLVDELVATYLPKIEQELRKRLQDLVSQSGVNKADPND